MSVVTSPNPLLLPGDQPGAAMIEVTASPGITITSPTGSTLDVASTITRRDYTRAYGHYLLGDFQIEGRYRDSEFLSVGAFAGYDRALAIDLLTSGSGVDVDTGAIRNSWLAGGDITWRPDAHQFIKPELRFERTVYSGSDLLRDASTLTAGLTYSRQTGPLTSIGLRLRDTITAVSEMADTNSPSAYATFNRRFGERVRVMLEIGVERAGRQIELRTGEAVRRPGRTLLAGRMDLCREATPTSHGLTGCVSATLNTDVSGVGGLRRDGTISTTVNQPLGEHFTLRGLGEYRRSMLIGATPVVGPPGDIINNTTDALRGVLTLDWKLRRDIVLSGSVQYLRRQLQSGQRIGAAFFGIQLSYKPGAHR